MRGDIFVDGRNNFDPELVQRAGFHYLGIGRGTTATPSRAAAPLAEPANPNNGAVVL
jgi:UDPglucose 6-dehydrogenase